MGDRNYGAIRDSKTAIAQIEKIILGGKDFAFDIEAGYTGDDKVGVALQQFHPDYIVVGISFTTSTAWARYIPFAHDDGGNVDNIIEVARALWRLLRTGRGVAHNAAYELKGMARWFRETLWFDQEVRESRGLFPILSDTMIEVWYAACYDPIRVGKDLKSVAKAAFGMEMTNFMDLFPSTDSDLGPATKRGKTKVVRFNTRNSYAPQVIDYACEDSVAALMIHQKHYAEVKDEFMFRTEMSLLPVLVEMEMGPVDSDGVAHGNMMFDWPEIQRRQIEVTEFAEKMNEEIQTDLGNRLGRTININLASVPQLSKVLFEERPEGLGLPVKQRSEKTGQPSTSDDALRVIAKTDPIIKKILQYRQVTKLNSSYLTKFLKELNYSGTGVVFPNHNQAGALTGRMSVDQVSYQQWPKPYHFGLSGGLSFDLNFRDLFVAQEDHRILGFDYANVELRVAGALSGEDKIIDAFNEGHDLHKTTASAAFGMAFDEVDKKHRGFGKALADDELVLTPSGWSRMGDMRVGDAVVVPSGGESLVAGVYPQGERQLYLVSFDDGTKVEADGEHRWMVYHHKDTRLRIMTTLELLESGIMAPNGGGRLASKWRVQRVSPLEFGGGSSLPIHPYLLGALLGDGSLSGPSVSIANHKDDVEMVDFIRSVLPSGVLLMEKPGKSTSYVFTSGVPGAYRNALDRDLKELGLRGAKSEFFGRFGVRSQEKFVPQEYLFASPEQRLEVLRGLLDTDGTATPHGRSVFVSTSEQLVADVEFLTRSLGGRAKRGKPRRGKYEYLGEQREGLMAYMTTLDFPEGVIPFRLARKVSRLLSWKGTRRGLDKNIVSIEPTRVASATCILVDDDEHQFITSGMTRTMNTLNFQILYGGGAAAVSDALTAQGDPVSKEQAQDMIDGFMRGYPKLAAWINDQQVMGREQKEVFTHFRRKFTIWEHYDHREWIRAKGDRMAVNAPVQGTAADIIKIAMVRAQRKIKEKGWQDVVRLTLTVHDALEFLVHKSISTQEVIDLIDPAVNFPVPGFPLEIRADWHEGYRWGSVAEVKLDHDKKITGYAIEDVDIVYPTFDAVMAAVEGMRSEEGQKDTENGILLTSDPVEEEQEWFHSAEYWAEHSQLVTITLDHMPDEVQWESFNEYLNARPGHDSVRLETPEGILTFDTTHKLTDHDQPRISILFGGASVSVGAKEADPDVVMGAVL